MKNTTTTLRVEINGEAVEIDSEDMAAVLNAATHRALDRANDAGDPIGKDAWVRRLDRIQQLFDATLKAMRVADLPDEVKRPQAKTVLHLRANNDSSGNPRRAFAVFGHRGVFLGTIDEGYEGTEGLYATYPEARNLWPVQVDVSVSEYKRFLRRLPVSTVAAVERSLDS